MFVSKLRTARAIMFIGLVGCGLGTAAMCWQKAADVVEIPTAKHQEEDVAKGEFLPDGASYDLGKVPRGKVCKLMVRVVNPTDGPLQILNLRFS